MNVLPIGCRKLRPGVRPRSSASHTVLHHHECDGLASGIVPQSSHDWAPKLPLTHGLRTWFGDSGNACELAAAVPQEITA